MVYQFRTRWRNLKELPEQFLIKMAVASHHPERGHSLLDNLQRIAGLMIERGELR